jgi:O-antigen ligase
LYAATGRRREVALLYLIAMTAPLEVYRTTVAGVDVSLFRLSVLAGVASLASTTRRRRLTLLGWVRHPLVAAYIAFGAIVLLAMLIHPINPSLGGREAAQIAVGVVTIATAGELARRTSPSYLAAAIVVGSFLPILAAAWQALAPKLGASSALPLLDHLPVTRGLEVTRQALSSFGPIGARAKGTFGDPNHFGVYLVFVLFVAFAMEGLAGRRGDRRAQVCFGGMTTATAATLVATFSRSAWIAALAGAIVITTGFSYWWHRGALRPPRISGAIAAALGALALFVAVLPSVIERAAPSSSINTVSDRGHSRTIRFALDRFTANPLLGIGPGGLGVELHEGSRTSGAHSTYLTTAAELGILGLFALLTAIVVALGLLLTTCRAQRASPIGVLALALTSSYTGYLAANATYDVGFDDFLWLMLGAVVSVVALAAAEDHAKVPGGISPVQVGALMRRLWSSSRPQSDFREGSGA